MENYSLFAVTKQKGLDGYAPSGLIGLSPTDQDSGAQLFVPSLFEQGAIKHNMFAMFIDQKGESRIQIGGFDLKKYASGAIKWYDLSGDRFWQFSFGSVMLGDIPFKPTADTIMAGKPFLASALSSFVFAALMVSVWNRTGLLNDSISPSTSRSGRDITGQFLSVIFF